MNLAPLSPAHKPHILVVDDDGRLRELIGQYLSENGFVVSTAGGAQDAREKLRALSYDALILDIMMPSETGLEMARALRADGPADLPGIPILFLTARAEAADRIEGFESGADDYVTKPFEPRELLLRLRAILRRAPAPQQDKTIKLGKWLYDPERDTLTCGAETIRLTGSEAGLLRALASDPRRALSREALAERAKGTVNDRTVDVQITRLRRKIEDDPRTPRYLVTVRGEGYMFVPDDA